MRTSGSHLRHTLEALEKLAGNNLSQHQLPGLGRDTAARFQNTPSEGGHATCGWLLTCVPGRDAFARLPHLEQPAEPELGCQARQLEPVRTWKAPRHPGFKVARYNLG